MSASIAPVKGGAKTEASHPPYVACGPKVSIPELRSLFIADTSNTEECAPMQGVPMPRRVILAVQSAWIVGPESEHPRAVLHGQVLHVPMLIEVPLVRLSALGSAGKVSRKVRLRGRL